MHVQFFFSISLNLCLKSYSSFRSFIISAMSMSGLGLGSVLSQDNVLWKFLAAWLKDGRMCAAFFSSREHRRTSLISSAIFRESTVGNTLLTRSSTSFLRTGSRHTRFNMNRPGRKRFKEWYYKQMKNYISVLIASSLNKSGMCVKCNGNI